MMHEEARRHRYLDAMGVQQWYARKRMSGAAASPVFTHAEESSPESLQSGADRSAVVELLNSANKVSTPAIQDAVSKPASEPSPQAYKPALDISNDQLGEDAVNEALRPAVSLRSSAYQFSLRLYRCENLLILCESADSAQPSKELQLLTNILRACQLKTDALARIASFSWPVFEGSHMQETDEVCGRVLSRWLHTHAGLAESGSEQESVSVSRLVCFGNASEQLLEQNARLAACVKLSSVPYSLAELLDTPAKKALVWGQLRKLMAQGFFDATESA